MLNLMRLAGKSTIYVRYPEGRSESVRDWLCMCGEANEAVSEGSGVLREEARCIRCRQRVVFQRHLPERKGGRERKVVLTNVVHMDIGELCEE